ncbi:unnamed protein product, partial [Brenthis ino]
MSMETIKKSLSAMTEMFNVKMSEFQQELHKNTTPVTTTSLAADFNTFKSFILSALNTLQRQVELLSLEIDRQEMRRRRKTLLFHGITEEKSEDILLKVTELVSRHLDLPNFSSTSIKSLYRLGRPTDKRPRPVVIKFMDAAVRDKVWFLKTKLKGTGVTQSEFLTKSRHTLFMEARQRFGIGKCWTWDGCVNIIAPNGSRHRVECLTELDTITTSKSPSQAVVVTVNKPSEKVLAPRSKRIVKK